MIGALNIKLGRDLWNIKGQILAIVMVMACGIATFIMSFGVIDSLRLSRDIYYDRYQFAEVFAQLERAPESVRARVAEIPGVSAVETRVVFGVTIQVADMPEPATGKLISRPDGHEPLLNRLYLRSGRFLLPDERDAILCNEAFAEAHGFSLGDEVHMVVKGHKRAFRIVGIVLSPEYIYALGPGQIFPDNKRFGTFWTGRRTLEAAVDMDGAFNDIALRLERGAHIETIKHELDIILEPYGGLIAYGRDNQTSHWFVQNELAQLEIIGVFAPTIFLAVAAFLINVVMNRLVATQREQIGMLKAMGYANLAIALHYLKMVLLIVGVGSAVGVFGGIRLGVWMTEIYAKFFHFPILHFAFSAEVMAFAILLCSLAAVIGTLVAIYQAARLPPAEAMRPQSPPQFRESLLEKLGLEKYFSPLTRIILRQVERRPLRTLFSTFGVALAMSILIFAYFMEDSIDHLMHVHFDLTQREDISLGFAEPRGLSALEEIRLLPGVMAVEPVRDVAVLLSAGHYSKRTAVTGLRPNPDLHRILDRDLQPVPIPDRGIALSAKLAEILHLAPGDILTVAVLEGRRPTLHIPVTAVVREFIGVRAFMDIDRLNAYLKEGAVITGAALSLDSGQEAALYAEIKRIPQISSMVAMTKARQIFRDTMGENLLQLVAINIIFASLIAFGVIYNTARIALSERGRELASLRVLGLTRREVAYILFGEMTLVVLLAIPLGFGIGNWMVAGMSASLDTELFRVPAIVEKATYGLAAGIILASSLLSFYLVWRQVDSIDLVSAQKGVE